jgi:hypothetical protein
VLGGVRFQLVEPAAQTMPSTRRWACLAAVSWAALVGEGARADEVFPPPFSRTLKAHTPPLVGEDVYLLRGLLARWPASRAVEGPCETTGSNAVGVDGCPFTTSTEQGEIFPLVSTRSAHHTTHAFELVGDQCFLSAHAWRQHGGRPVSALLREVASCFWSCLCVAGCVAKHGAAVLW